MKKNILILLAMSTIVCLAACQGNTDTDAPEPTPTQEVAPTLEPTATSTPTLEPTATSTPTLEPTATSMPTPEPTATNTPTPTPEPTATSTPTPEPTPTNTPTPTPEPTPTNTPTPTPTNTPTPKPTATPTPKPKYVKYNTFKLAEGCSGVIDDGGVLLVEKDGLWGAMDYNGKEILPVIFNARGCNPNAEGYFCLSDGETAWIFDKNGNVVMEKPCTDPSNEIYDLYVNEGVVTISYKHIDDSFYDNYAYDLETKAELPMDEYDGWWFTMAGLTAMKNGKYYFSATHYLYSVDKNGTVTTVYNNPFADGEPGGYVRYLRTPNDDYGAVRVTNDFDSSYRVGVISTDGTDVCLFKLTDLLRSLGYESVSWGTQSLHSDGLYAANVGKKLVLKLYQDGVAFACIFLDLNKAEYTEQDVIAFDYNFGQEKLVSNLEEIVVAQYEVIELSEYGIHYAYNDGTYFYMDDNGKVLGTYKDCCPFYNGYAAVIDMNGDAYIINTKFERVSEIFKAEWVQTLGNTHVFHNDGVNQIVAIEQ